MKINKEYIIKEVKKLDPKLKETDEYFKIACILLTGLQVGADTKKIAEFLKIDEKIVKKYEKNLRKNKIWQKEKTACDWFDKESGGVAFWCDVAVAKGYLKRSK